MGASCSRLGKAPFWHAFSATPLAWSGSACGAYTLGSAPVRRKEQMSRLGPVCVTAGAGGIAGRACSTRMTARGTASATCLWRGAAACRRCCAGQRDAMGVGAFTRAAMARLPQGASHGRALSWGALCTRFTACVSLSVYVWGCAPHPGAWDSCKRSVATHFEARTGRRTRQNEPALTLSRRRAFHVAGAKMSRRPRPPAGARSTSLAAQIEPAPAPARRRAFHVAGAKVSQRTRPPAGARSTSLAPK